MNTWYLISVFLHIVFACFWIGGMLFLPLVVLPGIRQHPDRITILYKTGITFRFYGWIALTLLATTGVLNLYFRGLPFTWEFSTHSNYGAFVVWKLVIFVGIVAVSLVHDFFIGNKALEEMRHSDNSRLKYVTRWSGRISLLLSLAMAFLGVVLSRGGAI